MDSRIESAMRFMGLAAGQRRSERPPEASAPRKPSEDELKMAALSHFLHIDEPGAAILLDLIEARAKEANLLAYENLSNHALRAAYQGSEAALRRLRADLKRLHS